MVPVGSFGTAVYRIYSIVRRGCSLESQKKKKSIFLNLEYKVVYDFRGYEFWKIKSLPDIRINVVLTVVLTSSGARLSSLITARCLWNGLVRGWNSLRGCFAKCFLKSVFFFFEDCVFKGEGQVLVQQDSMHAVGRIRSQCI